ncbi:hypothetical protein [Allorhizocola rhizosphaerae]|uniref:hypothetical protein n=1 Tax=Allorhizocola rhizosphaerae TaxID=1872709 RepID=UPI000E3DE5AE|nr:hypothetical protein [Allorhizocola rhizosphaerae]
MIGERGWVNDQIGHVDIDHFDLHPRVLGIFLGVFNIDTPSKVETVTRSFGIAKSVFAPFMVKAAIDMLPHLQRAVRENENARVVFVGRDAFSLGFATKILNGPFHARHCTDMYLSRSIVDAALAELEEGGATFADIAAFRRPARSRTDSAWGALERYFQEKEVDFTDSRTEIILVDSGYKGSVQEMLSAAFPDTRFHGHYIFFDPAPADPHPGTKRGYALNLDYDTGFGGRALRDEMPEQPELTYAHHEAIVAIEEMLQGSQLSPPSLSPAGKPLTWRYRRTRDPWKGLNPKRIAYGYRDVLLREGVLTMNVIAVSKLAERIAGLVDTDAEGWHDAATQADWYAELEFKNNLLRDQIRAWVTYGSTVSSFAELLDSFVHRSDSAIIERISKDMSEQNFSEWERDLIWGAFDRCRSLPESTRLAAQPVTALLEELRAAVWPNPVE